MLCLLFSISIYFLLQQVDCDWDEWQPGICSKECGGGMRTNKRDKIQAELYGGKPCEGNTTFEEECNAQECPGKPKKIEIFI